jgi:NAD(P)-dependent dehydrogenase (short-subunit alcohol dehydrogenase family)
MTALVTGASRGIGREVARVLAQDGSRVLLGVRRPAGAPPFANSQIERLDVGSPDSITACGSRLSERGERLDVLVNNAGVYHVPAQEVWNVNVRGPILLTRVLAPLLNQGARVVMVSSGMGQLAGQDRAFVQRLQRPDLTIDGILEMADEAPGGYGESKAALNVVARLFASELAPKGVLVNSVSPGWVRTDMGGRAAPRSIEQGAASVLHACRLKPNGPSGHFFQDGREIPW